MRLLETARRLGGDTLGIEAPGMSSADDAERLVYLVSPRPSKRGLIGTLEDVVNALWAMRGMAAIEAEAWLRRQLGGLAGPGAGERRE